MQIGNIIQTDPEIMSGTPVFVGTRVPVWSLFVHLEKGISLDDFLDDFPSVKREQAVALLTLAERTFTSERLLRLVYEEIAA
ncbi:MAG: DUF433 domain-containing protein [Cytophagia bacterium]|nr:MAG: DUF433 domain-containing protein [Cytophagales bacterium]TAG41392.1 MAG: DUF433 domain-containing protein [Cytophagia bacterium]TAG52249.1 MAG: DUF433 domain-containing protein [Runella slithyformis]TAG61788.1 MAG: DUF433 domain-containing protein [Runella slithyformis]TAG83150.1 MAG: DUF433 domain-containing protein [Cytophagales bacterium]